MNKKTPNNFIPRETSKVNEKTPNNFIPREKPPKREFVPFATDNYERKKRQIKYMKMRRNYLSRTKS